jgi:ATP-dependent RNA helicase RhlB
LVLNFLKRIHGKLKRLSGIGQTEQATVLPNLPRKQPDKQFKTDQQDAIPAIPDKNIPTTRKRRSKRPRSDHRTEGKSSFTKDSVELPPEHAWRIDDFVVPLADGKLRFHDLDLPPEILHAIHDLGFQYCTPIQAEIMPSTLAGKDASGRAQTGTGKTAAFLISIFTTLSRNPLPQTEKRRPGTPRSLILAPTRELVMQIVEEAHHLSQYCPFNSIGVYGGIDYEKQRRSLKGKNIDIMVATPGRLLDFQQQREINLSQVEIVVIDEADRMLDMGFIPDVRKIISSTPPKAKRQTLLFSATLTEEVSRLAMQWTTDPVKVEIEPEQVEVGSVNQIVYLVTTDEKKALLYNIITRQNLERVIVFCNRRDETRHLTELLLRHQVNCAMISGEIDQKKRIKTLEDFRSGNIRVMVATDVAGRGLHIEGVSHVINYTLPNDPEDYVHRIGRTGRAGALGTSISFACEEDSFHLPDIEALLGHALPCTHPDQAWLTLPPAPRKKTDSPSEKPDRARPPRRRNKPGDPGASNARRRRPGQRPGNPASE